MPTSPTFYQLLIDPPFMPGWHREDGVLHLLQGAVALQSSSSSSCASASMGAEMNSSSRDLSKALDPRCTPRLKEHFGTFVYWVRTRTAERQRAFALTDFEKSFRCCRARLYE
eukprot:3942480-Amphidinium_carterae.1